MRAILTYHSIDRSGSAISLTPEAFRAHVDWLARGTVRVVPLMELLSLPAGTNAVALTFDDALESIGREAAPLLAAHGFPATVFVVSRHVGGDNRWRGVGDPGIPVQAILAWDALERMRREGFTVGAHTRTHRDLPRCSPSELADELAGSADDISAALGERPRTFAYPYGRCDSAVARAAAAEFDVSCTTEFQAVGSDSARERVPRLDAWYFKDASRLAAWGTPRFARRIAVRHALRRLRRMAS